MKTTYAAVLVILTWIYYDMRCFNIFQIAKTKRKWNLELVLNVANFAECANSLIVCAYPAVNFDVTQPPTAYLLCISQLLCQQFVNLWALFYCSDNAHISYAIHALTVVHISSNTWFVLSHNISSCFSFFTIALNDYGKSEPFWSGVKRPRLNDQDNPCALIETH